jgi:hypothetical protein
VFHFLCSVGQQCAALSDATAVFEDEVSIPIQGEEHGVVYLSSQPGRSIVWMHCLETVTIILGVMNMQCIMQ